VSIDVSTQCSRPSTRTRIVPCVWIRPATSSRIDADPSRQALVAGLSHFTKTTGATLVAEGIERLEELEALSDLGVQLGQGFLLGRPAMHVGDEHE